MLYHYGNAIEPGQSGFETEKFMTLGTYEEKEGKSGRTRAATEACGERGKNSEGRRLQRREASGRTGRKIPDLDLDLFLSQEVIKCRTFIVLVIYSC